MCPWRTRVNASRCSGDGLPKWTVRVLSIVPSRYCAPESFRYGVCRLMIEETVAVGA